MDDSDFLKALSPGRFPSKEAHEYFSELRKSAGVKELALKGAREVGGFVADKKVPLLGALIGAAAASALQYGQNKPQGDKPSKERQRAENNLAAHDRSHEQAKTEGKTPGFAAEMAHGYARSAVDVAKTNEKHPVRGALLAAPVGAGLGYAAGSLGRRLLS